MTEILVGTKKGLFVLQGDGGAGFRVASRSFPGEPVEFAMFDPRTGRTFAGAGSPFYGPKLWWTEDPAGEWQQASGLQLPEGGDAALERFWVVVPGEEDGLLYAGGDPGVLFESRDGGESWTLNEGLWQHPTRESWQPGGGGLCLHTIVPWPGDPTRLSVGISAVGVLHTEDGGRTWRHANTGIVPRYVPEDQRDVEHQHCVHCFRRSPARARSGCSCSSTVGCTGRTTPAKRGWRCLVRGCPRISASRSRSTRRTRTARSSSRSTADLDRVTPGGRVAVYETRDAGATWTPRSDGLPGSHAYLTVLREAFDGCGDGSGLELYFGATSGDVFGSRDAGATWFTAASHLPPVYSVRVGRH